MHKNGYSLTESLVVIGIVGLLSTILFPVLAAARAASKVTNRPNLEKISMAAIRYGQDYDEMIPVVSNGPWRNIRNVRDGELTQYGEARTDLWPLILLPYVKDRSVYRDPRRDDLSGVWRGPALASSDRGYVATANTFRNQSRYPFFGVNYIFLSPVVVPAGKMGDMTPTDFMSGEARSFNQATQPAKTVFYAVTSQGRLSTDNLISDSVGQVDSIHGSFSVNAPGMWMGDDEANRYIQFWNGTQCSGDWCGDITPQTPDKDPSTNNAYFEMPGRKNNVSFLDGHVKMMTDVQLAAGTNYLTATPNGKTEGLLGGGARITDKNKYLWNLDNNYYGRY